jgi:hypothetical protein
MTEYQRLFLVQARSDFAVFDFFRRKGEFPACHSLHYLQMATEKLGKAHAWRRGPRTNTHRAFVAFLRSLATNPAAQAQLSFGGRDANWEQLIRKSTLLAERIEGLAPDISRDLPNPEYPWPRLAPSVAPAEHAFPIWGELRDTVAGRKFLDFITQLFRVAEQYL